MTYAWALARWLVKKTLVEKHLTNQKMFTSEVHEELKAY